LAGLTEHGEKLHETIGKIRKLGWVELEPPIDPDLPAEAQERDQRWHVAVRRRPERDE
jgi:hypothetical protein